MGETIRKKTLFVVMFLTVFMSIYGCGAVQRQNDNQNDENTVDAVYNGENLVLDGIEGSITDVIAQYGRVGIVTGEWIDDSFTKRKIHFYVMNTDQSELREIPLTISENDSLKKYMFDKTGNLILLDKYPSQISGGQKQRVAFARALVVDNPIILADEPTGALDEENTKKVMNLFKVLHNDGKTIVLITHDHNVADYADRIVKIRDGKIL